MTTIGHFRLPIRSIVHSLVTQESLFNVKLTRREPPEQRTGKPAQVPYRGKQPPAGRHPHENRAGWSASTSPFDFHPLTPGLPSLGSQTLATSCGIAEPLQRYNRPIEVVEHHDRFLRRKWKPPAI